MTDKRNYPTPLTLGEPTTKFAHKKSLGQNFLTSGVVPRWMCEAANVTNGEQVFEIGPGTGALTKVLLEKGALVTAVEADPRALEELTHTFTAELASGALTLHHGDARQITPETVGFIDHDFKVVANIPYYLSGFLLRNLLESAVQPSTLTFLIQKELAVRIARDKKESLLSLSVKAFGSPTYNKTVARGHFHPMPKVDSAVLTIANISRENFTAFPPTYFFEILHLGLGKKRKQLLTNLCEKYERSTLQTIFTSLNISLSVRGEDLALTTWLTLCNALYTQR